MGYHDISTIGQDSHAFDMSYEKGSYTIRMGGIDVETCYPISANSDGDVVLHAITNAVSGFTCRNILGSVADKMCLEEGIKDSRAYLAVALDDLKKMNAKILHLSISVECKRPKLSPVIEDMRLSLANILNIQPSQIGITATTGEGLTSFGRGEGIQVFVILTLTAELPDS